METSNIFWEFVAELLETVQKQRFAHIFVLRMKGSVL